MSIIDLSSEILKYRSGYEKTEIYSEKFITEIFNKNKIIDNRILLNIEIKPKIIDNKITLIDNIHMSIISEDNEKLKQGETLILGKQYRKYYIFSSEINTNNNIKKENKRKRTKEKKQKIEIYNQMIKNDENIIDIINGEYIYKHNITTCNVFIKLKDYKNKIIKIYYFDTQENIKILYKIIKLVIQ